MKDSKEEAKKQAFKDLLEFVRKTMGEDYKKKPKMVEIEIEFGKKKKEK